MIFKRHTVSFLSIYGHPPPPTVASEDLGWDFGHCYWEELEVSACEKCGQWQAALQVLNDLYDRSWIPTKQRKRLEIDRWTGLLNLMTVGGDHS